MRGLLALLFGSGDTALFPVVEVEDDLADVEALCTAWARRWVDDDREIAKPGPLCQALGCGDSKRPGGVDTDTFEVFLTLRQQGSE